MGLTLYYYSSTGNSLHAAQVIAAKGAESTLIAMPPLQHLNNIVPPTTSIGLVFPMHYFGLPPIVDQFVSKLDLTSVKYIFAIITCGDHHFSSCLHQIEKILLEKGIKMDSGFYIDMISSYVPLFPLPALKRRQQLLATADNRLGEIADLIAEFSHNITAEYFWWPSSKINQYWKKKLLPQSYGKFSCDATCTACGCCEKICPVANIRLVNSKPIWRHHCQECLACFHFCPVQSINFGTRTRGRERYHHPQVTAADIIQSRSKEQTKLP